MILGSIESGNNTHFIPELVRGIKRRDSYLEPEMVTARARVETIKSLGRRFQLTSRLIDHFLAEARLVIDKGLAGKGLEQLEEVLGWIEETNGEALSLSSRAEVGMAEFQLSRLIRDAAKRVYQRSSQVRIKLPGIMDDLPVVVHPQHLLDAISMAMGMVINRTGPASELSVTLTREKYLVQICFTGSAEVSSGKCSIPPSEDIARLKHLISGLHQGTITAHLAEGGKVVITMGLPLQNFR